MPFRLRFTARRRGTFRLLDRGLRSPFQGSLTHGYNPPPLRGSNYRAPTACRQAWMWPLDSAAIATHAGSSYSFAPMTSRSIGPS